MLTHQHQALDVGHSLDACIQQGPCPRVRLLGHSEGLRCEDCVSRWIVSDLVNETALLVWLAQETLQTQQYALDVVDGAPFVLKNIEANPSAKVNVGVKDGCDKQDCWWLVGVCCRKLEA